jgi:hypothetical protein
MGTTLASAIMATATKILQEENEADADRRWDDAWLFSGVNHGTREICFLKPDAYVVSGAVKLAAGTWQTLPANGVCLFRLSHNMGTAGTTAGRLITKVNLEKLQAYNPFFAAMDAAADVRHYSYDDVTPKIFAVIPPQPVASQGYVWMQYGGLPADLVKPPASYDVAIAIGDEFVNALTYFAVYWAYVKDADFSPGARERAQHWYQLFLALVGRKEQVEAGAVAPPASQHIID